MAQPKNGKNYVISSPMLQEDHDSDYDGPRITATQIPPKFARVAGFHDGGEVTEAKPGHKRSNTVGNLSEKIFGRHGSIFGGRTDKSQEKPKKSYPPVSMSGANIASDVPRPSMDSSRRSISFGFGKKRSGSIAGSGDAGSSQEKTSRRFSLLPASFSLKAIGIGKELNDQYYDDRVDDRLEPVNRNQFRPASGAAEQATLRDTGYDRNPQTVNPQHQRYASQSQQYDGQQPTRGYQLEDPSQSEASLSYPIQNPQVPQSSGGRYSQGFNDSEAEDRRQMGSRGGRGVLQKNTRKFVDAYEQDQDATYGGNHNSAGSSGAARKVMDFFRRRGKARESDDR
jgi:protein-serine/threonine kinase